MIRLAALILLIAVAGLLAAQPPKQPPATEPLHDGKPLSEWVKQLENPGAEAHLQASAAIRALAGRPDAAVEALLVTALDPKHTAVSHAEALSYFGPRAVPALTPLLLSADDARRRLALLTLTWIGEDARPAAPALVRLLADANPDIRASAAAALRSVAADSAIPALKKLLADPDERVRLGAARALIAFGVEPAVVLPVLTDALNSAADGVPFSAAWTIGELGPQAAPATAALVARLGKESPLQYPGYLHIIEQFGPGAKDAVPAIKGLLKESNERNRFTPHHVAVALWRIARDPDAAKLLREQLATWAPGDRPTPEVLWRIDPGPDTVAALAKLLTSEKPEVVIAAAGLLGTKAKDAVPLLAKLLAHKDAKVRARAVVALARLGSDGRDALAPLRAATKDDAPQTAFWAAVTVARLDPKPEAVAAVAGYLGDTDPVLRRDAAEALGALGPLAKPAAARLTAALTDSDRQVKLAAALALWRIDANPLALPAAVEVLRDPDPRVRAMAAVDIGMMVGPDAKAAVPELVKRLFDPFSAVRSATAEALGRVGPAAKDAAPALLVLLEGDEPGYVQSAACEALGLIDPADKDAAVAVLKRKLDHPDPAVRIRAALALVLVNGDRSGEKEAERGLGYRTHQVRITAAEALWRMKKDERVVPLLVRALEESNLDGTGSDNERYMAARALAHIGAAAKPAVPELLKLLTHHDAMLAATAAAALKAIDPDAAKKAGVK